MAAGPEAGVWVQRNPQSWGLRASGRAGQHGTGSNHSSPPTPIASPTLKAHTQTALRQFPGTRRLRDSEVRVGWEEGGCPGGFLGLHRNRQVVGWGRGEPSWFWCLPAVDRGFGGCRMLPHPQAMSIRSPQADKPSGLRGEVPGVRQPLVSAPKLALSYTWWHQA